MRIGMVLNAAFPPDIRLEKEIETLRPAHEVFLLCTGTPGGPPATVWNGVPITAVLSANLRRIATFQLMSRNFSRIWRKEIDRFVLETHVDVLHVHDLPLAGTAKSVARARKIPIVLDLHEDYPSLLHELRSIPIGRVPSIGALGLRLTSSHPRWIDYERKIVREMDAVITVVEEASKRILTLGVQSSRLFTVPNYAPVDESLPGDARRNTDDVSAIYIGGFDHVRDLSTVMRAADVLSRRNSALRIRLIGGSPREIGLLRTQAHNERLDSHSIEFHEWMNRAEAEQLLDTASIGLVPHVKSRFSDTTIPHKLFQYMSHGLPVVVSDCGPLQRIVREAECGLVYKSGDPETLANCLGQLAADPELRSRMGRSGREAVRTTYNWARAGNELLDLYRKLESGSGGS